MKQFMKALKASVEALASEHDLDVDVVVTQRGSDVTVTITEKDNAETDFRTFAPIFGYDADWFGKSFLYRRRYYTVCGVNPKASVNCLHIRRDDGKKFVAPVMMVREGMKNV